MGTKLTTTAARILADVRGGRFTNCSRTARKRIAAVAELQRAGLVDVHAGNGEYVIVEKGARVRTLDGWVG